MSITSDILRGHTEAIILSHLLEQDSYGYQINKDIMKKTDNRCELKEATLYSAFRRLEQAGYIRTYWGPPPLILYYAGGPPGLPGLQAGLGGGQGHHRPAAEMKAYGRSGGHQKGRPKGDRKERRP